ncbi:collagen, type I, alpha 1b-like [Heliangelus exortis]|uniref:collagen, type I, alpha 1b-like n=1 Tax=Heliangelus exortis TaxID=472823 RepID=UPI003A8D4662
MFFVFFPSYMGAMEPGKEEGLGGERRAGHRPLPQGEGCQGPGQAARPRGRAKAGGGEGLPHRKGRVPTPAVRLPQRGGWGGPGRRRQRQPTSRLREDEAFSFLLFLPSLAPAAGVRGRRPRRGQSPSRPRPAPASISSGSSGGSSGGGGSSNSNNLPSPCWKEATSGPRAHRCEARGSGGCSQAGRAGGRRGVGSPSARPVAELQVEQTHGRQRRGSGEPRRAVPAPGADPSAPPVRRAWPSAGLRRGLPGLCKHLPSSQLPAALGRWMNASPQCFHGAISARVPSPIAFIRCYFPVLSAKH